MSHQPVRLILVLLLALPILPLSGWADDSAPPLEWGTEAVQRRWEGVMLQRQGDTNGAIVMFQKAVYLDPAYATPHNDLGIAYESLGHTAEAEAEYQAALALDPGYLKAHTNLASLYERQGRRDLAGYHWLQRYTLGTADDRWTHVAEEHLIALGFLDSEGLPGLKPSLSPRERAAQYQFSRYAQLLHEFESITDPDGSLWSGRPYTSVTGSQAR